MLVANGPSRITLAAKGANMTDQAFGAFLDLISVGMSRKEFPTSLLL
jgi:hypothetical protein